MLGPSSLKFNAWPMPMVSAPVLVSPSLSVMVSVRVSVTRLAAASVTESSGLVVLECFTARTWSSVTMPAALTLTVKTIAPPALPARPTTCTPSRYSSTLAPVAVSSRPESAPAALTPSVYALVTVPAPSAP